MTKADNEKLTAKQQLFVDEYCTHFNGLQAAIAAGYSKKTAASQASQVLNIPKIQNAILAKLESFGRRNEILKQRIINELSAIAFSDIRDYLSFGPSGLVLAESSDLTRLQASAIASVKQTEFKDGSTTTFTLHKKNEALALLAKHVGLFNEPKIDPEQIEVAQIAPKKMSFKEFCITANYPEPFQRQIEMKEFGINNTDARLLLGTRGYGKTDYITILGVAYEIYLNQDPETSPRFLIITKSKDRNSSLINEISMACEKAGIIFEKNNSSALRIKGLIGKDDSVSAATIKSVSLRGRHPDLVIMDDPVTPEDTSDATRKHVKKIYDELNKLTNNILLIGQPVHKYDLYQFLRSKLKKKMEVVYGEIPELDHDLEAMRIAGVDEASIEASYYLRIVDNGSIPFGAIKYIDDFPNTDSVALIDPSHKGGDYTAITILTPYGGAFAVVGFVWKKAWNHCTDDFAEVVKAFNIKRLLFETNNLGDQPLELLRGFLRIPVSGIVSSENKHSRIMAASVISEFLHVSNRSHPEYIKQVIEYEYNAKFDDAPDSLATLLKALGLIRGKA